MDWVKLESMFKEDELYVPDGMAFNVEQYALNSPFIAYMNETGPENYDDSEWTLVKKEDFIGYLKAGIDEPCYCHSRKEYQGCHGSDDLNFIVNKIFAENKSRNTKTQRIIQKQKKDLKNCIHKIKKRRKW